MMAEPFDSKESLNDLNSDDKAFNDSKSVSGSLKKSDTDGPRLITCQSDSSVDSTSLKSPSCPQVNCMYNCCKTRSEYMSITESPNVTNLACRNKNLEEQSPSENATSDQPWTADNGRAGGNMNAAVNRQQHLKKQRVEKRESSKENHPDVEGAGHDNEDDRTTAVKSLMNPMTRKSKMPVKEEKVGDGDSEVATLQKGFAGEDASQPLMDCQDRVFSSPDEPNSNDNIESTRRSQSTRQLATSSTNALLEKGRKKSLEDGSAYPKMFIRYDSSNGLPIIRVCLPHKYNTDENPVTTNFCRLKESVFLKLENLCLWLIKPIRYRSFNNSCLTPGNMLQLLEEKRKHTWNSPNMSDCKSVLPFGNDAGAVYHRIHLEQSPQESKPMECFIHFVIDVKPYEERHLIELHPGIMEVSLNVMEVLLNMDWKGDEKDEYASQMMFESSGIEIQVVTVVAWQLRYPKDAGATSKKIHLESASWKKRTKQKPSVGKQPWNAICPQIMSGVFKMGSRSVTLRKLYKVADQTEISPVIIAVRRHGQVNLRHDLRHWKWKWICDVGSGSVVGMEAVKIFLEMDMDEKDRSHEDFSTARGVTTLYGFGVGNSVWEWKSKQEEEEMVGKCRIISGHDLWRIVAMRAAKIFLETNMDEKEWSREDASAACDVTSCYGYGVGDWKFTQEEEKMQKMDSVFFRVLLDDFQEIKTGGGKTQNLQEVHVVPCLTFCGAEEITMVELLFGKTKFLGNGKFDQTIGWIVANQKFALERDGVCDLLRRSVGMGVVRNFKQKGMDEKELSYEGFHTASDGIELSEDSSVYGHEKSTPGRKLGTQQQQRTIKMGHLFQVKASDLIDPSDTFLSPAPRLSLVTATVGVDVDGTMLNSVLAVKSHTMEPAEPKPARQQSNDSETHNNMRHAVLEKIAAPEEQQGSAVQGREQENKGKHNWQPKPTDHIKIDSNDVLERNCEYPQAKQQRNRQASQQQMEPLLHESHKSSNTLTLLLILVLTLREASWALTGGFIRHFTESMQPHREKKFKHRFLRKKSRKMSKEGCYGFAETGLELLILAFGSGNSSQTKFSRKRKSTSSGHTFNSMLKERRIEIRKEQCQPCNDGKEIINKAYIAEEPDIKLTQPPTGINTELNYQDECSRERSFHGCPELRSRARDLARSGLYLADYNVVKCHSCHKQHHISELGDRSRWHFPTCFTYNWRIPASHRHHRDLHDVVADAPGRVSDDIGDPPGQQSVYIPPGDVRNEIYRLSTFEQFPVTCPISRKSLAKSGFYFTGFFDRVKCFACGRTVERWEARDNPAELRWHKPDCPFPRGDPCGNIPINDLFNRLHSNPVTRQQQAQQQQEQVLTQTDPNTGAVIRTVRYPADLPERIRRTGGTFQIGPGNSVIIQSGPGSRPNPAIHIGNEAAPPPPRRWRMANVVSADHRRFLSNLYLNRELDRLTSYARWPAARPNVSPAALAKSGFFYLGDMDRTQCFSCGGVLRNWTLEDDAHEEHRTHFPSCAMVRGAEDRNVPVPEEPELPADRMDLYPCRYPANPHMRAEAARLDTFDHRWPAGRVGATPAAIAQAGFFFLGERDRVKCWYCNGGLQNWEYDDIPWNEHAKWFPNCQFLLQNKGQGFIHQHLAMSPHLARPIIAKQEGSPIDPAGGEVVRAPDIPPGGPSVRQPTPPPEIIDPQEEMRKKKERIENIMRTSDICKNVIAMGFSQDVVRQLLEERVDAGNEANPVDIYESASALLDDVMKKEEEIQREAEAEEAARNQASMMSSVPSTYSANFSSLTSSLGPAPGSGKYNVSFYDEDEPMDDQELYGSMNGPASVASVASANSVTATKQVKQKDETSESLQEQLLKIEEERMCKICFSNTADMVFIPCSHMCCCMECTQAIRQCPVCRKKIEKAIKTYVK